MIKKMGRAMSGENSGIAVHVTWPSKVSCNIADPLKEESLVSYRCRSDVSIPIAVKVAVASGGGEPPVLDTEVFRLSITKRT